MARAPQLRESMLCPSALPPLKGPLLPSHPQPAEAGPGWVRLFAGSVWRTLDHTKQLNAAASQGCLWRDDRLRAETWLAQEGSWPTGGQEGPDEDCILGLAISLQQFPAVGFRSCALLGGGLHDL